MTSTEREDVAAGLAVLHAEVFEAPWSAKAFGSLLSQPAVILELAADGFVLAQHLGDEAEILTLAVRPAARRRGIATLLIEAVVDRTRAVGAGRLLLEVAEDNKPARALYDRMGFELVGRRPRYYARTEGPPVDALLLARNLGHPLPSA